MKKRITRMIISMAIAFTVSSLSTSESLAYEHKITSKKVTFEWNVNGDRLDIRLSAPTTGWVGIGFNPSKKMKDANFILGYVKGENVKITDDYGNGNTTHGPDTKAGGKNHVTGIAGSEENGVTNLSFSIPLNSGDSKDKSLDVKGDTVVLLAYGSGRDSFKSRHKAHSILNVNLSTGLFKDIHKH